ncbi:thiamine phosphate synthase [Paenibacillus aurantius]|uniref:Thiamine-phosphate synthase n=1 Tax=Paenibacillus aurantius TaxID=2918900 RepID=A0AA96LII1_9BACL|nr:thiamine phosphate synthase [Paenibacillus aurantius]WNQ13623.1 thiamine phosphate synthase [Paenibacillus aurantius]
MSGADIRKQLAVYLVMGLEPVLGRSPVELAGEALSGGVTMLQLREKNLPLSEVLETGRELRELCRKHEVPFLVNDRVDVALLLDADGVHVGQEDIPAVYARKLMGPGKIIGVSAGTPEEAEQAVRDGADYLGVGSIYATSSKADAGEAIGTALISEIKERWNVPQVAIGGITAANAGPVIQAGADGVAVISAITRSTDPREAAAILKKSVMSA